jgi:hypothetical protein
MTFKVSWRAHTVTPHSVLNRKKECHNVRSFCSWLSIRHRRYGGDLRSNQKDGRQCTEHLRRDRRPWIRCGQGGASAGGAPYLHIIVERSTRYAAIVAAGLVLFGLLSPTTVTAKQRARVATDLSVSATATDGASHAVAAKPDRNGTTSLTSHSPWLAPVGHRQPRRAGVPQDEASAARARQQFRLDNELDRKLIICRCS